MAVKIDYYKKRKEDVLSNLETSSEGLSSEEANRRLLRLGKNVLAKRNSVQELFSSLFKIILFIFVLYVLGLFTPSFVMLFLYIIIGWIFNIVIEKIKIGMGFGFPKVLRDKKECSLNPEKIVPGDILSLNEGNKIPADAYLLEKTHDFQTQEETLTGFSSPINKKVTVYGEDIHIRFRKNMIYSGTTVRLGSAKAVVTKTGNKTAIFNYSK